MSDDKVLPKNEKGNSKKTFTLLFFFSYSPSNAEQREVDIKRKIITHNDLTVGVLVTNERIVPLSDKGALA